MPKVLMCESKLAILESTGQYIPCEICNHYEVCIAVLKGKLNIKNEKGHHRTWTEDAEFVKKYIKY